MWILAHPLTINGNENDFIMTNIALSCLNTLSLSLSLSLLCSSHGRGDEWDTVIYPGMKQALINALQVTQDEIEHRKVSHTPSLNSSPGWSSCW